MKNYIIFWTPRIFSIILAIFLSVFALDVFNENLSGSMLLMALLIHLVPSFLMVGLTLIAWKWELAGAICFFLIAVFYTVTTLNHLSWILIIALPIYTVSVLYFISWLHGKKIKKLGQN